MDLCQQACPKGEGVPVYWRHRSLVCDFEQGSSFQCTIRQMKASFAFNRIFFTLRIGMKHCAAILRGTGPRSDRQVQWTITLELSTGCVSVREREQAIMLNRCMALLCFWVKSVRLLDMDCLESWTGQQAASEELSRRATAARATSNCLCTSQTLFMRHCT